MEPAADGIYVHERQRMVMRAVGQKDKYAVLDRIDPERRTRKTVMPKAFGRHFRPRGRAFGRSKLEGKRAVLVHSLREIRPEKLARLWFQKLCVIRQELKCEFENFL